MSFLSSSFWAKRWASWWACATAALHGSVRARPRGRGGPGGPDPAAGHRNGGVVRGGDRSGAAADARPRCGQRCSGRWRSARWARCRGRASAPTRTPPQRCGAGRLGAGRAGQAQDRGECRHGSRRADSGSARAIVRGAAALPPRGRGRRRGARHRVRWERPVLGGDDDAVARWLQQLTHVRDAISRLDAADTLAALVAAGHSPSSRSPSGRSSGRGPDRWIALAPQTGDGPQPTGRVAVEARLSDTFDPAKWMGGLMVDEWVERVPEPVQTTAVAFHYEEPGSRAPQAVLVAVCPDERPAWDADLVLATAQRDARHGEDPHGRPRGARRPRADNPGALVRLQP